MILTDSVLFFLMEAVLFFLLEDLTDWNLFPPLLWNRLMCLLILVVEISWSQSGHLLLCPLVESFFDGDEDMISTSLSS